MNAEQDYLNILDSILTDGIKKEDRTGTGTLSLFGSTIKHDYSLGFPLLTTKKMAYKAIIHELLWFLKGTEDATYLKENNCKIWDEWMKHDGHKYYLPHTYGVKWRNFDGTDQIQNLIDEIDRNPDSRRLVVSAWDPRFVSAAALTWCHILFQINIVQNKYLDKYPKDGKKGDMSIAIYQRSADWFLGVPFNIASYSFLLYMIAQVTGYRPKHMHYTFGDSHVYLNHIEQCQEQISRKTFDFPVLKLNKGVKDIDSFSIEDFSIEGYQSHSAIKGKVSV